MDQPVVLFLLSYISIEIIQWEWKWGIFWLHRKVKRGWVYFRSNAILQRKKSNARKGQINLNVYTCVRTSTHICFDLHLLNNKYFPNFKMNIHFGEKNNKNILKALNDDCLSQIFEKIDHLVDIYSITYVCKRFKSIGKIIFPSIIKREYIRFAGLIHQG